MVGGAAGRGRSRPTDHLHAGAAAAARFPVYSLFPQLNARPALHKVTTESLFSSFGVQNTIAQQPLQLLVQSSSMEEAKLGKESCCPGPRDLGVMTPLSIKTEAKRPSLGPNTHSPKKVVHMDGGCSRTNPVAWLGLGAAAASAGGSVQVQVKREPQLQLADLVAVKLEQASPGNKPDQPAPGSMNNGSIPVGIAVARQRVGDAGAGLLAALAHKDNQRMHELDAAAAPAAMTVGVANVLCDERPAPLWPAPPTASPSQPLWQYPAAQMSMESMMVGGMGSVGAMGGVGTMGGVGGGGYQLVREPTSGALLLLPAAPELGHVLWGGYGAAPLLLPPQPPHHHQLQLLPDLLTSATLQHTHTHSTRLVALAPAPPAPQPAPVPLQLAADKRKPLLQPLLTPHTLIKIEPEHQEKQQPFAGEPQPLLTHVYYQGEFPEQGCRSQATSPAVPTPPPTDAESTHKDASNQTDHIDDDDDSPNQADDDERDVACVGVAHSPENNAMPSQPMLPLISPPIDSNEESSSEALATSAVVGAVEKAIDAMERDEALDTCSSGGSHELVIDTASTSPVQPPARTVDLSGLELLSNSIEQFERTTPGISMPSLEPQPLTVDTRPPKLNIMIKMSPKSPPRTDVDRHRRFEFPTPEPSASEQSKQSLDGLGLLCALAEQRIMQEVQETPMSSRKFIKSELLSPTERVRERSNESKKDRNRHRHKDSDSSNERRRKRSHDREERHRHKLEKIRRRERERGDRGSELEASLRRVTACPCGAVAGGCSHQAQAVPSAAALVSAMERDMRARLQDLERQCHARRAQLTALTPPPPTATLDAPSTPSTPALSPDSDRGSSKKRKVGRPRKVSSPDSTETIVAKKPKSKSSLVGFLLAKSKLKGGVFKSEPREDGHRTSKVRPKLKAEPILKVYSEEDDSEWRLNRSASSSMESLNEVRQKNRETCDRLVRKHSRDSFPELELSICRASGSSDTEKERRRAKKRRKSVKSKERSAASPKVEVVLTDVHLEQSLPLRVLTAMGGLFYAGRLSAVTPPDVYAVTLDGERGNKPHILSREETLRDAILEVSPGSVSELAAGTRVCAYWSQQYRCLYPGSVAGEAEGRFVPVEFDDGDSGRIALEDIRLLQHNYPVVEYENPLFTLGKRRRNTSATEEKKPPASEATPSTSEIKTDNVEEKRDKKKLKKHRKDKIKRHSSEDDPNSLDYVKKKKKKHKCCDEHCKHRKHKKHHRKHRKRHHSGSKEHSESSGDDRPTLKSSSDYVDSNKSNDESGDSNDRLSTLIAVEKSPDEMKTVIKKAVVSKKALVKNAILDYNNQCKASKAEDDIDNLKDSGIGLEDEASTSTADGAKKKAKRRSVSTSSEAVVGGGVSKMAAFLPGGALWRWRGAPYRRTSRPRQRKLFYRAITRHEETLNVGECAVFLSLGRADRPYIGRLLALWEARGHMCVRVQWFYHPEETQPQQDRIKYPGGLFESPHTDENDVQTISHKCEVLSFAQYRERMGDDPQRYRAVYDNNDVYYRAGHYDPTPQTLALEPDIPFHDQDPAETTTSS